VGKRRPGGARAAVGGQQSHPPAGSDCLRTDRIERIAEPFHWTFTRRDLAKSLARLDTSEEVQRLAARSRTRENMSP